MDGISGGVHHFHIPSGEANGWNKKFLYLRLIFGTYFSTINPQKITKK